jgi:succinate dehydrogenase / fumarate reductase membrane anchor subunit
MAQTAKADGPKGARVQVMQSRLGRARGLGSARSGTAHWWQQRLTAVALVPLTLWFVAVALHLAGLPRAGVAHWAARPLHATLLLALVVATFHHAQLGLQMVIEDYVHGKAARLVSLLLVKGAAVVLGLAAAISVLKLAFAG